MSETGEATEALGTLVRMEAAARRKSGWYGRYLLAFAMAQPALLPAVLLWHDPLALGVSMTVFMLFVAALSIYATRQRAVRRGFGARHLAVMGSWGTAYTAALLLGSTVFMDDVGFAVAATFTCTLPMAIGAWLERRQGI